LVTLSGLLEAESIRVSDLYKEINARGKTHKEKMFCTDVLDLAADLHLAFMNVDMFVRHMQWNK